MTQKKAFLNFCQLWNMSFGFFGIQFGWGLQMANTSAIFEYLGADAHQLPLLWLAAPLTGLIVQPIIGNLSDRTWSPLGRRRPYFLVGAIFSSIALVLMPNAPNLWIAAGLLWILDTSANVSMTPFRSFVGDLLPEEQHTQGFAMQSLFHGLGAVIASALPWLLTHVLGVVSSDDTQTIPIAVQFSFYIGAAVFLGAILWTVATTQELPPLDMAAFKRRQQAQSGWLSAIQEIFIALRKMPPTMQQLAWVQCFSWLGMYCVFLYFPPAIAHDIFGAADENSLLYAEGIEWAGLCMAAYNLVCCAISFILPKLAQSVGCKMTHTFCLLCGGVGLISLLFIRHPWLVLFSMGGLGIAWASILSIPYVMLMSSLPPKQNGMYMGIFNLFIVLPEILASLGLGWVMDHLLHENRLIAVAIGGACMFLAAWATQRVRAGEGFEAQAIAPASAANRELVEAEGIAS